jgi:hypothetical protein
MRIHGHECSKVSVKYRLFVAGLLLPALTGCGSGLAEVSGIVTVDGQPLRGGNDVRATVCFQPTNGGGLTAVGLLDENGAYRLSSGSQDGVAPGEYAVTCSATQLVRGPDGSPAGGRRITDPAYANAKTSGLKFTVQPGDNEFNLTLHVPSGNVSHKRTP